MKLAFGELGNLVSSAVFILANKIMKIKNILHLGDKIANSLDLSSGNLCVENVFLLFLVVNLLGDILLVIFLASFCSKAGI